MTTLTEIEIRRVRDETIRKVIERLAKHATDNPARIGNRVLAWKHQLTDSSEREKLRTFAKRRNIKPATASEAVAAAQEAINDIRFPNVGSATVNSRVG